MVHAAGDPGWVAWTNGVDTSLAGKMDTTAVNAAIASSISALQATTASIDDLFISASLFPTGVAATTSPFSTPVVIAPFPLVVTSVSLVQWGTTIAASDTNYWTFTAQAADSSATQHTIAARTTQVVGGGAMTSRIKWTFDATTFTAYKTLNAGDILSFSCVATGAPTAIGSPLFATVGYRPV